MNKEPGLSGQGSCLEKANLAKCITYSYFSFFLFYILSFIEMTEYFNTDRGNQNEPEVYVRLCVCLSTFLTARPDRTCGPIFMKFGTRTKMLMRYRLPEVLWDALIL